MAEFLRPDVYIIEKASARRPLTSVATSTAAIVGVTQKGPVAGETVSTKAQLITSWSAYLDMFGTFLAGSLTPHAVFQFFNNGGQRLWVSRIISGGTRAYLNLKDTSGSPADVIKLEALYQGAYGNSFTAKVEAGTTGRKLTIVDENGSVEVLDNVAAGVQNFVDAVNARSAKAKATFIATGTDAVADVAATALTTGSDGSDPALSSDFDGTSANRKGLHAFDAVDEVLVVMAPDASNFLTSGVLASFNNAMTAYCEDKMTAFALVDSKDSLTPSTAETFFTALTASSYGSKYWPWVVATSSEGEVNLPPSCFVAAKMGKIDSAVGVHQPAAGVDFPLQGVVRFAYDVTDAEQDTLNPKNINILRSFPGYGPVIWGARTMGTDTDFRYNSVRRLFIQIEKTLKDGTKPFVFKPNTPDLRDGVQATVRDYLIKVWKDGALKGRTISEAFFVKCDDENNPPQSQDDGKLIIQVGLAATRPAEFVIFEIGHLKDGASTVSE